MSGCEVRTPTHLITVPLEDRHTSRHHRRGCANAINQRRIHYSTAL